MVYEIKGKVFLITGAATGIGSWTVKSFLEEGPKHIAVLDIAEEAGLAFEKEMNDKYGANKVKFFKCDVTNDRELDHAYEETLKNFDYIDVVINNAALMNDSENVYRKQIEINITALVNNTLKAYHMMSKDKGGRGGSIINISSIAALQQAPPLPIYFATKSFVLQFSNCLGLNSIFSRTGVRIVTVCFGCTDTALFSKAKLAGIDEIFDRDMDAAMPDLPLQRPESAVAGVIAGYKYGETSSTWLASDDKPAVDITKQIRGAYGLMSSTFSFPQEMIYDS